MTIDQPARADDGRRTARRPLGRLFELVETLALTLVLFLGIQAFVAQPFQLKQESMERTLEPGQYVLVDKLTPRFGPYARGDIVVFTPPAGWAGAGDTPFIKRVVGLPGEWIEIRDGTIYIDGRALEEPYVFDGQPTEAIVGRSGWLVGPDELFVMGDHRVSSVDSRTFGPIRTSSVVGRAWLRYWPLATFGVLARPTWAGIAAGSPTR